ncbi:MAG: response regulator transcription factor [Deltaproteobacteria bacterium]|nr:response regulator transcription factor [Deltaproteobacteria bacterium]
MNVIRVMVVEDQPKILRNQLKLLSTFEEIEVVGTAPSGENALEQLEELSPDVILLDLGLPGIDGIGVTQEVKARKPEIEILIFTIFDEEDRVLEAIKAGASGYLLKGTEAERIVDAIKEVRGGGSVIQPSLARRLLRHFQVTPDDSTVGGSADAPEEGEGPAVTLTAREVEILQLISKGLSNSEAAEVLSLSKATVRTHLEHIYEKLDVTNRVEAVTEGIRKGIIEV